MPLLESIGYEKSENKSMKTSFSPQNATKKERHLCVPLLFGGEKIVFYECKQ
jgi:hypothetical protein